MRFKPEYTDILIKCPFTGKMVNTFFVDPALYPYYFNKGLGYMFTDDIEIEDKKDIDDDILGDEQE